MRALIFDTETTGRVEPELIEAAWLAVSDLRTLEVEEQFVQRYRPAKPIEMGAMAVHHILEEDLLESPPASSFRLPEDTGYLVGHSIDYDWGVIGKPDVKRISRIRQNFTSASAEWAFLRLSRVFLLSLLKWYINADWEWLSTSGQSLRVMA